MPGKRAGRVRVDPTGLRSSPDPGGPILLGGKVAAAQVLVQGTPGRSFSIRLPERIVLQGPGDTLPLSGFLSQPAGQSTLLDGACRVSMGGALEMRSDQTPGSYRGLFEVTVAYE
jgi:hypothetical protein